MGPDTPSAIEASASITTESPMRISPCPILPSGCGIVIASSVSNVDFDELDEPLSALDQQVGLDAVVLVRDRLHRHGRLLRPMVDESA
jgi:hypothetical protein